MSLLLPQIIVEVILTATNPVKGSNNLILDDPTFGLLNTDFLATGDTWTDISQWVWGFDINQSSTRVQGPLLQFTGGTASITLDNSDGRFDPDNLSGPYVVNGQTQVHPMTPVRIRAVFGSIGYPLFSGFADSWAEPNVTFAGQTSTWTLDCSDAFKILAGINLATIGAAGSGELSGARMNRILDACGWYTGAGDGARSIDVGNSQMQATTFGDTALNLLQLTADSEIGWLYIDGSGAVKFRSRRDLITETRSNTSQATFGDNPPTPPGPELPCSGIARTDDDTTIANDIQATRVGGSLQEVTDATSLARYLFPRTYSRTDLILVGDADVLNWANWVLYVSKNDEDRFASIDIDPQASPLLLWPQVLSRRIGDRVTVVRRPNGVTAITRDGFISGVTHSWDTRSYNWSTTFTFQDASKYAQFLILNDSVFGQLDHNALVY